MPNLLVSVCVLTYNHQDYIQTCLDSILTQEVDFNWEIIISDDNSTDSNRKIIDEYKNNFPNLIQLIYPKQNVGVIGSLINLLNASTGKYVAICEGDDFWIDSSKLKKQVEILEANDKYSMVCSNRTILDINGIVLEDHAYIKDIYTTSDILKGFIPGTQTVMFRNFDSLIRYFQKYSSIYSGDRYLAYYCSLFGDIFRMSDFTATYRITHTGIWSRISPIEKLMRLSDQLEDFHSSIGLPCNNSIIAEKAFTTSFSVLLYSLKRPKLLFSKGYIHFIFKPFIKFGRMNPLNYMFKAVSNRFSNSN